MLPKFRSMQGRFVKVYRGYIEQTERSRGEKAVKVATEFGFQTSPRINRIHRMYEIEGNMKIYA